MTDPDHNGTPGLRERKKRQTRALLSSVALRLAVERGITQVRVEDIAAEAGISPRTFNNYFSSKEAAIVSVAAFRADQFCTALRARPAREPLHAALTAAALDLFADEPDRDWIARVQLIRSEPSLVAEERKSDAQIVHLIATEIAARTNGDASVELQPHLAAALVVAAIHVAIRYWLDNLAAGTLRDALTATMRLFHIPGTPPTKPR
ncbi:MAG: TetR/AcrR family transcriptional regulator [Mycobacterium sp.]